MENGASIYQLIAVRILQKLDNAGKLDDFYDFFNSNVLDENGKTVDVTTSDFQKAVEKELINRVQMLDIENGAKQEVVMVVKEMIRIITLESLTAKAMCDIKGADTNEK